MRGGRQGRVARCVLAACLAGCGGELAEGAAPRPDVVLVTWDTARADHVGPDAAVPGLTPRWNRVAASGTRFGSARTPSPMTLPAHASLLTGRLPPGHGARVNTLDALPDAADTLAERLAAAGWRTGAFVSAAVLDRSFGLAQGFTRYDDRVGDSADRHFGERRADATVDAALAWVASVPDTEAIHLWVHLFDPHTPWEPPAEHVLAHPGEPYRAEIAFTDAETGRLLDGLAAAGRLDRALLAMTADHGEGLGEHGELTHGYFVYDATARVPLLLAAGDRSGIAIAPGSRIDAPALLSDVAPTLLDLLGLEPLPADGTSLAPLLRGEAPAPREIALESVDPWFVFGAAPVFGVVDTAGHVWIDLPRRERYDPQRDPGQLVNLYRPSEAPEADALFARHPRAWPPPAPAAAVDPALGEQLAALGYVAARTGAAAAPTSALRPDPKDLLPVAALWMGQHERRRPDHDLAEAERLARRFGPLPALAFFRADRLMQLARPDDAIAVLREASLAHPAETRLRDELETSLRRREESRALAERIRAAWEAQPDHPQAAHDLAVVLHRLGELAEAERLYRQWLARHPDDSTTRLDLHRLLGAKGDLPAALALLREVPPGPARDARLDCAEGRLLLWWMDRPDEARAPLLACRDRGQPVGARELEAIETYAPTSQVSPERSSLARSPSPRRSIALSTCPVSMSS